MRILGKTGHADHAVVYILQMANGHFLECVESVQPPIPRNEKWVLLVSTLYGCPIGCPMCDAGGFYHGKPGVPEIFSQIDFLVTSRFPDGRIPCKQFKIQFARMGEPALNPAVLDVLVELPNRYKAPGLMPSISTIAPRSGVHFFNRLLDLKQKYYTGGRFQLQFSIHTTDSNFRKVLIPADTLSFSEIAAYSEQFFSPGDRKVTLNFIATKNIPVNAAVLLDHFSPERFLIKITPLNPTYRAMVNGLHSRIDPMRMAGQSDDLAETLKSAGYDVIVSIGNTEENLIGSNCGQYVLSHLNAVRPMENAYSYPLNQQVI